MFCPCSNSWKPENSCAKQHEPREKLRVNSLCLGEQLLCWSTWSCCILLSYCLSGQCAFTGGFGDLCLLLFFFFSSQNNCSCVGCCGLWQWARLPWQTTSPNRKGCSRSHWQSGPISNLLLDHAVEGAGTWAVLLKSVCAHLKLLVYTLRDMDFLLIEILK